VRFKSRESVEQNKEFVSNQLQEYLHQGVLKEHKGEFEVKVCNPLGVVENRQLKKRLYLDGQYINAFDRYEAFTYEKLSHVPEYLTERDCIMLTDLKSGYHQLRMHEDTLPYLCIEFGQGIQIYPYALWLVVCLPGLHHIDVRGV
jgi:hypothetical protein